MSNITDGAVGAHSINLPPPIFGMSPSNIMKDDTVGSDSSYGFVHKTFIPNPIGKKAIDPRHSTLGINIVYTTDDTSSFKSEFQVRPTIMGDDTVGSDSGCSFLHRMCDPNPIGEKDDAVGADTSYSIAETKRILTPTGMKDFLVSNVTIFTCQKTKTAMLSKKNLAEIPEEILLTSDDICSLDLSHNPRIQLDRLPRFKSLRKLILSNCLLSVVPEEISELGQLEELVLSGNNFSEGLHDSVGRLKKLRKLDIHDCNVRRIPEWIGYLEQLEELVLWGNELSEERNLAVSVGKLKKLRILDLHDCQLTCIHDWVGDLEKLEDLNLSGNNVHETVILAIARLRQLKTLKLAKCGLTTLPESIGELKLLVELDVSWNIFSRGLHHGIQSMHRLKKLTASRCGLTSFPDWLGNPKLLNCESIQNMLEELDISDNKFSNGLHPSIGNLKLLKKLTAHHCEITSLPESIGGLENLEELDISGNELSRGLKEALRGLRQLKRLVAHNSELTDISDSLGDLKMVEEVDLAGNSFSKGLNPAIGQLTSIKILALQNCEIAYLPDSLGDLTQLNELDLSGNSFSDGLNSSMRRLYQLKKLRLVRCELSTIPKCLIELRELIDLELSHNNFSKDVGPSIRPKFRLKKLSLISCELKTVPDWLYKQEELEELDLSRNSFSEGLELVTSPLFRLKKLSLIGCELTTVPKWLCEQRKLDDLDLSRNNFSMGLDLAMRPMFQLTKLSLAGCDLTALPAWISEQKKLDHSILKSMYGSDVATYSFQQKDRDLNSKAIANLYGQITEIMLMVGCEIGISSYIFRSKTCELVVHPRDTRDTDMLKRCLQSLIKKYRFDDVVKSEIVEKPAFATFCYSVEVNQECANIGMYILENDLVYWLSVAHSLVIHGFERLFADSAGSKELHVGNIGPLFFSTPEIRRFKLPSPYACFLQPDNHRFMVDIMVGPMLFFGNNLFQELGFCTPQLESDRNLNTPAEWHKASIMDFPSEKKLSEALDKQIPCILISYSWPNRSVLEGLVSGCGVIQFRPKPGMAPKPSTVIYIKSLNGVVPKPGDSGSVWATWIEGKGFEAVAITNGVTDNGLWGATPLIRSLNSLREMYPHVFPNDQNFTGFGLFLPRDSIQKCRIEF